MRRVTLMVAAVVLGLMALLPHATRAQVSTPAEPERDAVDATIAAVRYLFVAVDSIESVLWPSAKALLARRPGIVALSGISTRFGEDPARAIALTERVAADLNGRAIAARTIPRSDAQFCGIGNSDHCSLPDGVGVLLLVGYPHATEVAHIARLTIVTDSSIRSGRPVISLDVVVRKGDGGWTVASIARSKGLSE